MKITLEIRNPLMTQLEDILEKVDGDNKSITIESGEDKYTLTKDKS